VLYTTSIIRYERLQMSDFLIDGMEKGKPTRHMPNKVQKLSSLELFVGIYKTFSFMGKKF